MKRHLHQSIVKIGLVVVTLGAIALGLGTARHPAEADATADNLIINGSMEEGFYWKYPNHFVANNWFRWWTDGSVLPEYDDTRTARPHYDGEHAQVYFKWGSSYEAGMYQVVYNLTPCVYYQLEAYGRTHSVEDALPHARIGLDPTGTQLTKSADSGAVKTGLPPQTVWSREQTQLYVWEQLTVTAEALTDHMTAILYAKPEPVRNQTHFYDTYWDAVALYPVAYPADRLPAPSAWSQSDFVSNITPPVLNGTDLTVEWDTLEPALSQAWYTIRTPEAPITPSETMSRTTFMPVIGSHVAPTNFPNATPISGPATHHTATLPGVSSGQVVQIILMARRLDGSACVTEHSQLITYVVP